MNYHGVLLLGALVGAGAVAFSTACSGPDPGAISFAEREPQGGGDQTGGSSSGTGGSSGSTADGGGSSSGTSGGDPIFGTSTFAYVNPGLTANGANSAHAGTVEGKNCIQSGCHQGGNRPWVFGGTVYTAAKDGQTVPRAEVRMVGTDGKEIGRAYTDANGNFWFDKAGVTIPAGAKVGVRREGGTPRAMATLLQPANSGCGNEQGDCHGTATTGKIYAP